MRIQIDLNSDNPADLAMIENFTRFFSPKAVAHMPADPSRPAPPARAVEPPPRVDELARGRAALVELLTLWSRKSAFPLDAAEKITHHHGEFLLIFVEAHGGLRNAIDGVRASGELHQLRIDSVPTLLSMLSALGIPLPSAWFNDDYADDDHANDHHHEADNE